MARTNRTNPFQTEEERTIPPTPRRRTTPATLMNDDRVVCMDITMGTGKILHFDSAHLGEGVELIKDSKTTGRFWVHHKANRSKATYITDAEMIRRAEDATGKEYKKPETAAEALGYDLVWLVLDENGEPARGEDGLFIEFDKDAP